MRFFSRVSVRKTRLDSATDKQVYFSQKTKRMIQLNKGYRHWLSKSITQQIKQYPPKTFATTPAEKIMLPTRFVLHRPPVAKQDPPRHSLEENNSIFQSITA